MACFNQLFSAPCLSLMPLFKMVGRRFPYQTWSAMEGIVLHRGSGCVTNECHLPSHASYAAYGATRERQFLPHVLNLFCPIVCRLRLPIHGPSLTRRSAALGPRLLTLPHRVRLRGRVEAVAVVVGGGRLRARPLPRRRVQRLRLLGVVGRVAATANASKKAKSAKSDSLVLPMPKVKASQEQSKFHRTAISQAD